MEETNKKRGFYVALAAVIVCVFTVAVVYKNTKYTNDQQRDLASLEESNSQNTQETADNQGVLDNQTAVADNSSDAVEKKDSLDSLASADVKKKKKSKKSASSDTTGEDAGSDGEEENESVETMGSSNTFTNTAFDEEAGLLWPVEGNVLMKYSMDKGIYFQTLSQYKCNPAIIIESSTGTSVHSSADCTVTEISENEETGLTVTTALDDRYNVIYGQLSDLEVKVGDQLKEGDVIGKIAKPTKYYITEGSNLYLQVIENGETVDPLLLLR